MKEGGRRSPQPRQWPRRQLRALPALKLLAVVVSVEASVSAPAASSRTRAREGAGKPDPTIQRAHEGETMPQAAGRKP